MNKGLLIDPQPHIEHKVEVITAGQLVAMIMKRMSKTKVSMFKTEMAVLSWRLVRESGTIRRKKL